MTWMKPCKSLNVRGLLFLHMLKIKIRKLFLYKVKVSPMALKFWSFRSLEHQSSKWIVPYNQPCLQYLTRNTLSLWYSCHVPTIALCGNSSPSLPHRENYMSRRQHALITVTQNTLGTDWPDEWQNKLETNA